MTLQLAVVASGNGSNAQAIFDAIAQGRLDACVRIVFSNRPGARVLDRAEQAGIPSLCLDHTMYSDRSAYDRTMAKNLHDAGAEVIALAGYMRLLTADFLHAFPGRVLNIHPALLPAFPGVRGAGDAQDWGVKIAGCTVHFVDEEVDHGAVIVQAAVPALPGEPLEDLQARIHRMEHRIYPQALQWLATGRIELIGRQVHVRDAAAHAPVPRAEAMPDCLVWPPLEEGF